MFQARIGVQSLGLPGKKGLHELAAQQENGDSSFQVTQRLPELLELYARKHFVEGSTPATITFYRKEVGLFVKFLRARGHSLLPSEISRDEVLLHLGELR